jgi:hypothetical protein
MLVSNIGIKSRILQRSKLREIRLENVSTLRNTDRFCMPSIVDILLSLVVFHINTKPLLQVLSLVLVFKYYLSIFGNAFNGKTDWSFSTIIWQRHLLHIRGLLDLGISDFVWFNLALDIHFIINKLTSAVSDMLLLQDIVFGISEGLVGLIPALCLIPLVRNSDSEELFVGLGRWVVTNDDELSLLIVFLVVNGAFDNRVIL